MLHAHEVDAPLATVARNPCLSRLDTRIATSTSTPNAMTSSGRDNLTQGASGKQVGQDVGNIRSIGSTEADVRFLLA